MENNEHIILEQYKMYVEMMDRVSERRLKTNQFYIGLITGILAFLTFVFGNFDLESLKGLENTALVATGCLGIVLNGIWFINIRSFRNLNSGKFDVIHEMEKLLPFNPYDLEWDYIKRNKRRYHYLQLTIVEQYLPLALSIPFILLLILGG